MNYDVIIIGAGIAGLGVAGLLQSQGVKTIVLEKSKIVGGRCKTREFDGWKVDSGIHCVELGEFSACAKLLKKLGKEISWSRPIEKMMFYDEGQWKSMEEFLSLTGDEQNVLEDLKKWMINLTDEEIDALDNVSLTQFLKQKISSPRIAEFLKIVGMIQTTLTETDIISAGESMAILREGLRLKLPTKNPICNNRMPLGGIGQMMKAMADAYVEKGGELLTSSPVRNIKVKPGEPFELVMDNRTYQASKVVVAAPIWDMLKFLSMEEMAKYVPQWASRMSGYEKEGSCSMGFTIGIKAPLFTEPAYLSAWRLPNVSLPLQVLGHTNFDDTLAPPNHMIAFIGACCTPAQALDKEFRERTLNTFWKLLPKMFPNIENDLVWRQDGFYVGIDGLSRSPGMTGRYRPPVHLSEIPRLYFAGDCYTGRGIGMNAAANSAMICAAEVLANG